MMWTFIGDSLNTRLPHRDGIREERNISCHALHELQYSRQLAAGSSFNPSASSWEFNVYSSSVVVGPKVPVRNVVVPVESVTVTTAPVADGKGVVVDV